MYPFVGMTALPEAGSLFADKYLIDAQLGEGAVGVILAATHTELRQKVAIKLLRDAAPVATERMIREARAALSLHSEHIVRVMDVGRDAGRVYVVMELLEGTDLASLLRSRGRLPPPEAVDCVLQACAGVAEAHSAGIVHRDLKPSNLFLTRRADNSPLVKVLDFGVAKSIGDGDDGEGSLTGTRELLGSPMYMSPEQTRGSSKVDHRADIWSLGVILYRLLTGSAPFGAPGAGLSAALLSIVSEEPKPMAAILPNIAPELEAVVMRCLAKDPKARFASVAELAAALAPFGTDDGRAAVQRITRKVASPVAIDEAAPPAKRSRRGLLLVLGAVLALLCGVPVVIGAMSARSRAAPPPTTPEALSAPAVATDANPAGGTAMATATETGAAAATSGPGSSSAAVVPGPVGAPHATRPAPRPRATGTSRVVRSAATDERY